MKEKRSSFAISKDAAIVAINAAVYLDLHRLKGEDIELYKLIVNINQSKEDICKIVAAVVFFDIQNDIQKISQEKTIKFDEEAFVKIAHDIFNKYFIIANID